MCRGVLIAACLAFSLSATGQSFGTLAHRIGVALEAQPVHPRLIGFFTFFTPVRVAVYTTSSEQPLAAAAATLGSEWQRIVRTRARDGEESLIYVRQDVKNSFRMLILNHDGDDNQVQILALRVKPRDLLRQIDQHRGNP
ncbi:MAG: hypothetical protein ACRD1C_00475 [Terriglobales bacterium]